MDIRKKAASSTTNSPKDKGENTQNICIRTAIKNLFRSGKKFTAKRINQLTHSNDARKAISTLRREGWDIQDVRQQDGSKLYWLAEEDRQCTLNFQGECL